MYTHYRYFLCSPCDR